MPAREGNFRVAYDPDVSPSVARPFRLEGEGKGSVAGYPRGAARPKPVDIPGFREGNPLKLYPKGWLKNLPHVKKNLEVQKGRRYGILTTAEARLFTGNKKAQGGAYLRVPDGFKYFNGHPVAPNFKYVRVNPQIADILAGNAGRYANDPKQLLAALRFLYRNNMMKDYRVLSTYAKRRTHEIREGQLKQNEVDRAAHQRWAAERRRAAQEEADRWKVS